MRYLAALAKREASSTMMKTTLKQIGMILLAGGFLAFMANSFHPRKIPWIQDWSNQIERQAKEHGVMMVSLHVARELFDSGDAVFIDARSETAFAKGHIPGAASIPFEQLDMYVLQLVELVDTGDAFVVYCRNRNCDDALLLAAEIRILGGDAVLFADGYDSWKKHGGRTE